MLGDIVGIVTILTIQGIVSVLGGALVRALLTGARAARAEHETVEREGVRA